MILKQSSSDSGTKPSQVTVDRSGRWQWLLIFSVPILLVVGLVGLLSHESRFYLTQLDGIEPERRDTLSKEFLARTTRVIGEMQNEEVWQVDFDEDQMNAWLAEDFKTNHAGQGRGVSGFQPARRDVGR